MEPHATIIMTFRTAGPIDFMIPLIPSQPNAGSSIGWLLCPRPQLSLVSRIGACRTHSVNATQIPESIYIEQYDFINHDDWARKQCRCCCAFCGTADQNTGERCLLKWWWRMMGGCASMAVYLFRSAKERSSGHKVRSRRNERATSLCTSLGLNGEVVRIDGLRRGNELTNWVMIRSSLFIWGWKPWSNI